MSKPDVTRFAWSGRDFSGHKVHGECEARDLETLKRQIYGQGILVSTAKQVRPASITASSGKITASGITVFLRQCASLLKAGLPLVQSMEICIEGTTEVPLKTELQRIRDQLSNGASFHSALCTSRLGNNRLLVNLVQAAEQSGTLDVMMEKLARDSEKNRQLHAKVKKALTYPVAVLIVAVVVTVVLLMKVVPQFARTFSDLGAELPALTRSVVALSDLVVQYALISAIVLVTCLLLLTACLRRYRRARFWKDKLICQLPVTGDIVREACLARFCQILGESLKAGVPMIQALQSSAPATGNLVYEQACLELAALINEGQTLSFGIRKTPCFPVMIGQLIHAGEQSGTLDQMLENCARRYEQSVDNTVDKLSTLIEPVIMTIMGIIVGTLMLAMYLPIFRLGAVL